MVGVPCAAGEQEAEGKVTSQILVSSDSQSATGLGTREGRGMASPGGSHLGQQRGPSLRTPLGPSRVSSWTGLQGAPSIFLPQDPGRGRSRSEPRKFWAGESLAYKLQPCKRRPRGLWAPVSVCFLVQGQLWAEGFARAGMHWSEEAP